MEEDERKTGWREERSRSRDGKQYVTKNKVQKKGRKKREREVKRKQSTRKMTTWREGRKTGSDEGKQEK